MAGKKKKPPLTVLRGSGKGSGLNTPDRPWARVLRHMENTVQPALPGQALEQTAQRCHQVDQLLLRAGHGGLEDKQLIAYILHQELHVMALAAQQRQAERLERVMGEIHSGQRTADQVVEGLLREHGLLGAHPQRQMMLLRQLGLLEVWLMTERSKQAAGGPPPVKEDGP